VVVEQANVQTGLVVARLARIVERGLAAVGLTLPQYRTLSLLATGEQSSASRIAWAMSVKPATVTAVMDGLVSMGAVLREADPHDRRKVVHRVTEHGTQLLETANARVTEALVQVASHLGEQQADELVASLSRWQRALTMARLAEWEAREGTHRGECEA
jgi:DNA-binding MarR family transcriptional regulator